MDMVEARVDMGGLRGGVERVVGQWATNLVAEGTGWPRARERNRPNTWRAFGFVSSMDGCDGCPADRLLERGSRTAFTQYDGLEDQRVLAARRVYTYNSGIGR